MKKRRDFGSKPWCFPQPVFIIAAYDENGNPDAMNCAWGGISEYDEISFCLSPGHRTVKNILSRKDFTVSPGTVDTVKECDFVGMVSGNDFPDKLARSGFSVEAAPHVDAPMISELPMAIECRLLSYDKDSCLMRAKIVNICAQEDVLDENGRISLGKIRPISLDPIGNTYNEIGTIAGDAFVKPDLSK